MSSDFLSIFVDSASGVSRIVLTVIIGAVGSWGVKDAQLCFKDFGYIITNVLVPSLFFTHMLEAVNVTLLLNSSILIVFSVISVLLGYVLATVATRVVFPDTGFVLSSIPTDVVWASVETNDGDNNAREYDKENRRVVIEYDPLQISQYLSLPPGVLKWDDPRSAPNIQDAILATLRPPVSMDAVLRPNGYRCMLIIGSMIQNTFVLPLSLVESLRSSSDAFDWIDLEETTAFIFFFNIVITVMFWTAGPLIVKSAAKEHEKRVFAVSVVKQFVKFRRCVSTAVDTSDIQGVVSTAAHPAANSNTNITAAVNTNNSPPSSFWESIGGNRKLTVRCKGVAARRTEGPEGADATSGGGSVVHKLLNSSEYRATVLAAASPMLNLPIVSLFVGLLFGLIPWTRWLFMEGPFTSIREPLSLLGDGTIPAALLLLGANLTSNFSSVEEVAAAMRHFSHGPTTEVSALNHHRKLVSEKQPPRLDLPDGCGGIVGSDAPPQCQDDSTEADSTAAMCGVGVSDGQQSAPPPKTPKLVSYSLPPPSSDSTEEHLPDETEMIETWAASFADASRSLADELDPHNPPSRDDNIDTPTPPGRSLLSLFDTNGIDTKLLVYMCAIRLIIMPLILFVLVHFTVQSKAVESVSNPQKNVLLLTLLVETSAPSAINTALLFSIYQFMTAEYSKCLLYQYTASMLTMVLWLTAIIAYTS